MSRPQQHPRLLRLISAALGLAVVVSAAGCSAGQVTQTSSQVAAVNGGSGQVGAIAVRDARFSFPARGAKYRAGSSAPIKVVLANGGNRDDRLIRVTSPYATSPATITGITDLPAGAALRSYGVLKPQTSQTQAPTGEEPESGAPASQAPTTGPLPPAPANPAGVRTVEITLAGLRQDIGPGVTIPVTFVFQNAGAVTVQVPIGENPNPRADHGQAEAH